MTSVEQSVFRWPNPVVAHDRSPHRRRRNTASPIPPYALLRVIGASLVLLAIAAAPSRAVAGDVAGKGTLMTTSTETRRPAITWFFRERPQPDPFVLPDERIACAVTRVTVTAPIGYGADEAIVGGRQAEKFELPVRIGGRTASPAKLRIEESVPLLGLSQGEPLIVEFYDAAPPDLPEALKRRGLDRVYTGHIVAPVGESVFVMLCRRENGYVITYALINN